MIFDIEVVEEIHDEALFIRKIAKNDAEFLFNSLNNRNLTSYLSLGPLKTIEESKRLIKRYLKYWERYTQFNYIIELRDHQIFKIGSISLWNVNWRHERAEVGIWLNPLDWNKGYGKRSLNLIKIIAFNHLKLNRLEAHIANDNQNSIHLFQNCGFIQEGLLKRYLKLDKQYHDALILSCLK
ncbi:MAG: GNAT family N-acetyltransferase [Candidatus Hermodarchaeota archaeon]